MRYFTLLAFLLAGCAPTVYEKPGATNEDFQRAMAGCRVQGRGSVPSAYRMDQPITVGASNLGAAIDGLFFERDCMRAQGYVAR